jgi:hypothetical protein
MFSTLAAGVFWLKQAVEEAFIASLIEVRTLSTDNYQDWLMGSYLGLGFSTHVQHWHSIDAGLVIDSIPTAAHKRESNHS